MTGTLTIPNSVTSIGDYAFSGCSGLTSVTIPNSVTRIREYAFSGCSGLTSVTIPNSVTSIGQYTFKGCSGLTSVTIGSGVTSIGVFAFSDCTGLSTVDFNATNCTSLGSSDHPLFDDCSNLTTLTIGSNVTRIPDYAFYGCSGLASVVVPDSVTSIGQSAFSGCRGLTDVTIGRRVSSIGDSAFAGGDHIIQMTCKATVPPTVADVSAFDEVFRGIPLYVPTASVGSYQVAYAWREFTNYIGMTSYTLTVQSADPSMGTVSGGGSFAEGATATLTAMPKAGYRFVRWQDGNTMNPRTVTVSGDATYTAYFEAVGDIGIGDTEEAGVNVYTADGRIVVDGAEGMPVEVYDVTGRKVAASAAASGMPVCRFEMPAAGVYLVKVGDLPARRIVVVR